MDIEIISKSTKILKIFVENKYIENIKELFGIIVLDKCQIKIPGVLTKTNRGSFYYKFIIDSKKYTFNKNDYEMILHAIFENDEIYYLEPDDEKIFIKIKEML